METFKNKEDLLKDLQTKSTHKPYESEKMSDNDIGCISSIYADCHIYGFIVNTFDGFVFVPFRKD